METGFWAEKKEKDEDEADESPHRPRLGPSSAHGGKRSSRRVEGGRERGELSRATAESGQTDGVR